MSKVQTGDRLPELEIPVTTAQIVSGAIASQEFEDVHHDTAAAKRAGTPDIFMNILTTNGLVGRYLTDWAGPRARIRRIRLKLGVPNFPGDLMTFTGKVISLDDGLAEIEFRGKNSLGSHVTGVAIIALEGETGNAA